MYIAHTDTVPMELMGIWEIAQAAGVSPQAVSNWVSRKRDFPRPLAQLASGPVWEAKPVMAWLEQAGVVASDRKEKTMDRFRTGGCYTLAQTQAAFGGDAMSYLPQVGNRIVCGRFTKRMNPNAPYEVLVGEPPQIQRKAELLDAQGGELPVFVKESANQWRYHGAMRFERYETDGRIVGPRARAAGRSDVVVGMLVFADPT